MKTSAHERPAWPLREPAPHRAVFRWITHTFSAALMDVKEFFAYPIAVVSTVLTSIVMVVSFGLGTQDRRFMIDQLPYFQYIVPGIFAMGTMYSCIYSAAYTVLLDRQRRFMDDIVLSPIAYSSYVFGRIASTLLKSLLQLAGTVLLCVILLGMSIPHPVLFLIAFLLSGALLAAIGMMLGARSTIVSLPGLVNVITIPLTYFSGIFFPIKYYNRAYVGILEWQPFASAVELFRFSLSGRVAHGSLTGHVVLLLAVTAVMLSLSVYAFRRAVIGGRRCD
jgi:ABC-2 type transport system permease protein